jgi:hypothetical protein
MLVARIFGALLVKFHAQDVGGHIRCIGNNPFVGGTLKILNESFMTLGLGIRISRNI